MAKFNIPEGWTIKGNELTDSQNAVLSVFEAQIRGELTADKASMFLRMDSTDEQIAQMAGVALAIYRVTVRVLWGSTWDEMQGTKRQIGKIKTTKLDIDQTLTIDFNVPEFDIERFLISPENIGLTIVSNWTASFTRNLYENFELIFLQGAVDYAIAKSLVLPIDLINATPDKAVDAYYKIWARNNRLIKKVDDITVGINREDLIGAVGIDSNMGLSKAFVRLNYGQISADTVVTGRRYTSNIAGMEFWESFYFEQMFNKDNQTAMHLENSYDLFTIHGFVTHKRMWGMPISFTKIRSKLDNATDNVRIIGKCLYALPAAIRPDLMYVIMPSMPTIAEIEAARLKDKLTNPQGENLTYQSTMYDKLTTLDLRNIIFFDNLGNIPTDPVITPEIIADYIIKAGNNGFDKEHVEIINITANSALIKPKQDDDSYYAQVIVKFNLPGENGSILPPSNADLAKAILNLNQSKQNTITLGEGLGWENPETNVIKVTNKVNALNGAETLNPDDFVVTEPDPNNPNGTIKVKK